MGERFAITSNGDVSVELSDRYRSFEETFEANLCLLDGSELFSYSLWAMPDDAETITDVDLRFYPDAFLQCAGMASRMTVEVRVKYDDGLGRLFTVGRSVRGERKPLPSEDVHWSSHIVRVYPNEVFGYKEVSRIFLAYLETGKVPTGYSLRGTVFSGGQA